MRLVYGISRWTNTSRAGARHIDNSFGEPLCGGNGRKAFTWETEEGEPTCKKCIAKYKWRYKGMRKHRISEPQKCPKCHTPMTVTYLDGEQILTCPECVTHLTQSERIIMKYDHCR